jgi:hypothetical protein
MTNRRKPKVWRGVFVFNDQRLTLQVYGGRKEVRSNLHHKCLNKPDPCAIVGVPTTLSLSGCLLKYNVHPFICLTTHSPFNVRLTNAVVCLEQQKPSIAPLVGEAAGMVDLQRKAAFVNCLIAEACCL